MQYLLIFFGALMRLIPHIPNFAPITALGLFGGTYLNKKTAFILPIAALLLSDILIGFYSPAVMIAVYLSFALSAVLGMWLKKRKTFGNVLGVTLVASVQFYLITNFAVWVFGTMYPHTLSGLMASYTNALPFFRNSLLGNMTYVGILFGAYELARYFIKNKAFEFVSDKK